MFAPRDPPEDGARAAQLAAWEVAWHSGLRPRQSRLRAVPTPSLRVSSAAPAPSPAPSACGALPPGARARLSPVPAPRLLRVPPAFPAPIPGRSPLLAVLRWARLAASFRAASAPSPHPPPPRSRERAHRQASRPDAWSGQGGQPDRGRPGHWGVTVRQGRWESGARPPPTPGCEAATSFCSDSLGLGVPARGLLVRERWALLETALRRGARVPLAAPHGYRLLAPRPVTFQALQPERSAASSLQTQVQRFQRLPRPRRLPPARPCARDVGVPASSRR